jgi:hypothetical protein
MKADIARARTEMPEDIETPDDSLELWVVTNAVVQLLAATVVCAVVWVIALKWF